MNEVSRKNITMIVGLDIDGVLADFLTPFLQLLEEETGSGPITAESVTDFNFTDHPVLSEKIVLECFEKVSYSPSFWKTLSPLITPGDWQKLDSLSREDRLLFITHRYVRDTYDLNAVTCDWLKLHGISKPVVHFTNESKAPLVENLGIRFFMDDRYENCRDVAEQTQATVLMPHRSYNQSFQHPSVKRIQS
ncbi:MAG TPA: hypothetical protein VGB25_02240, partial [Candidatus Binatia bacterium]